MMDAADQGVPGRPAGLKGGRQDGYDGMGGQGGQFVGGSSVRLSYSCSLPGTALTCMGRHQPAAGHEGGVPERPGSGGLQPAHCARAVPDRDGEPQAEGVDQLHRQG
ncbi:hypothetical protein FIBSPDRAFT_602209 [Athelia psychrophila]|uniref:Uncharacterized protein n=1 Tax=Athelia psychrophila TaxID=1759441 RepID=A0A166GUV8_9AGAM|nr:hypothetical protein FIBSPDRAFT_602209 [Fibularhizoctonia sp. CBS 109695]